MQRKTTRRTARSSRTSSRRTSRAKSSKASSRKFDLGAELEEMLGTSRKKSKRR
ncbi:MAG: hypothetical protein Q7S21_01705 [archaeon]|nr:hypothetical protein [archaeon]